jgi:hypothetical protein
MASNVVSITSAPGGPSAATPAQHTVPVPPAVASQQRLESAIEAAGLTYDARAIWLVYPNLRAAADRLVELFSADWPCRNVAREPAAILAVLQAIKHVKEGMRNQEDTRNLIVANFLHGLATAADDIAGTVAWGFQHGRPVGSFDPLGTSFEKWSQRERLTEVRFFIGETLMSSEVEGFRLKILCAVANAKDVGVATRYRNERR